MPRMRPTRRRALQRPVAQLQRPVAQAGPGHAEALARDALVVAHVPGAQVRIDLATHQVEITPVQAGEHALQQALVQARQAGKTVVVITHRSHMLAVADTIAVVKDGQIMLQGPRDHVLDTLKANRANALKNSASANTPSLQNIAP